MVATLPVVIRADDLKALIASAKASIPPENSVDMTNITIAFCDALPYSEFRRHAVNSRATRPALHAALSHFVKHHVTEKVASESDS